MALQLTEEEMGYDLDALKDTIQQCRENKAQYNLIVHDPKSDKETVIEFMKRVNMEDDRIRKLERIIEIREATEKK